MQYLIGTDEAGYGPNLGPLVISATLWQVPDGVGADELYGRLGRVVVPSPGEAARDSTARVAMADSKLLYRPGKGLRQLERGLWAALSVLGHQPRAWGELWEILAPESARSLRAIPWYAGYGVPLPREVDSAEFEPLATALGEELAAADVRLVGLRSRVVFADQFNALLGRYGSKGTALSHATLELASQLMRPLDGQSISVVCDKHGGRNRYGGLLSAHFPDRLVEVYAEGRRQSVYRFGPPRGRVEFRFQMKAESCLPVALASMASKYLRELAMEAFNAYWRGHVDDLRPTAGYPQDARRFKAQIATVQAALNIDDHLLWRTS